MSRLLSHKPRGNNNSYRPTQARMQWQTRESFTPHQEPLTSIISRTLGNMASGFLCSIAKMPKTSASCRYYGHVVKDTTWYGPYPTCGDCGVTITSTDMIRKATIS